MIRSKVFVGDVGGVTASAESASAAFNNWLSRSETKVIRFVSVTTNTTPPTDESYASHVITVVVEFIDETE